MNAMNRHGLFKFRLYVADDVQNSARAIDNLGLFCRTYLADRYHIEVVDVFKHPRRALEDNVLMTPTLVRFAPAPLRRIVGTLSETLPLLQALGMQNPPA
jgi:circadian clock protein KaiB